jgi:hypothetical protein
VFGTQKHSDERVPKLLSTPKGPKEFRRVGVHQRMCTCPRRTLGFGRCVRVSGRVAQGAYLRTVGRPVGFLNNRTRALWSASQIQ